MWIARDKDNELYAFVNKPRLSKISGRWCSSGGYYFKLKTKLFPEITWDNEKSLRWKRFLRTEQINTEGGLVWLDEYNSFLKSNANVDSETN